MEAKWLEWFEAEGQEIEEWISDSLEQSREVFEFADGTHAKWVSANELGLLITIDIDDVIDLLAAWDDAHAGSYEAAEHVMNQTKRIIMMLERAIGISDP